MVCHKGRGIGGRVLPGSSLCDCKPRFHHRRSPGHRAGTCPQPYFAPRRERLKMLTRDRGSSCQSCWRIGASLREAEHVSGIGHYYVAKYSLSLGFILADWMRYFCWELSLRGLSVRNFALLLPHISAEANFLPAWLWATHELLLMCKGCFPLNLLQ